MPPAAHPTGRSRRRGPRATAPLLALALLALATAALLGACNDASDPAPTESAADGCTVVSHDDDAYCVGRFWITETGFSCVPGEPGCTAITETGFSCPADASNLVRHGDHFVCAPSDGEMSPELRNEIVTTLDPNGDCATAREPAVDHDADLLSSAVEDKNRNCIVDPGETDWLDIDTDGDHLSDGHEDHNHNGIFEPWRGETSPLLVDTDGDGTADTFEWGAARCHPYILEQPGLRPWGQLLGRVSVALAHGHVIGRHGDRGGVFGDPSRGVFGFVVEPVTGAGGLDERLASRLTTTAALGHTPLRQHMGAPSTPSQSPGWTARFCCPSDPR